MQMKSGLVVFPFDCKRISGNSGRVCYIDSQDCCVAEQTNTNIAIVKGLGSCIYQPCIQRVNTWNSTSVYSNLDYFRYGGINFNKTGCATREYT